MSYKLVARTNTGAKALVDPSVLGSWVKFTNTVPALSVTTIEVVALADFNSLDYIITLFNDTEEKARRFSMTIIREGSTLKDNVSGRVGSLRDIKVDAVVSGSNLNLNITNDNNYDLEVSYAKLTL